MSCREQTCTRAMAAGISGCEHGDSSTAPQSGSPLVTARPAKQKSAIKRGSPTAWPTTCARWLRAYLQVSREWRDDVWRLTLTCSGSLPAPARSSRVKQAPALVIPHLVKSGTLIASVAQ